MPQISFLKIGFIIDCYSKNGKLLNIKLNETTHFASFMGQNETQEAKPSDLMI